MLFIIFGAACNLKSLILHTQVNKEQKMCKMSGSLKLTFEGDDLKLNMPLHFYNVKDCSVLDLQVST